MFASAAILTRSLDVILPLFGLPYLTESLAEGSWSSLLNVLNPSVFIHKTMSLHHLQGYENQRVWWILKLYTVVPFISFFMSWLFNTT